MLCVVVSHRMAEITVYCLLAHRGRIVPLPGEVVGDTLSVL